MIFRTELAAGAVPSIRQIKGKCKVGQERAKAIRNDLAALVEVQAQEHVPVPG